MRPSVRCCPPPTRSGQALYAVIGVVALTLTVLVLVLGAVAQGWFTHGEVHGEERRALEQARAGIDATLIRLDSQEINLLEALLGAPLDGILWESGDDPDFPEGVGSVVVYTLELLDQLLGTPYNWVVIEATGVSGETERILVQVLRVATPGGQNRAIFGNEGLLSGQRLALEGGRIDRLDSRAFPTVDAAWAAPWGSGGTAEILGFGQFQLLTGAGALEAHGNLRTGFDQAWWLSDGSQPFANLTLDGEPALNSDGDDFNPDFFNTLSEHPSSIHPELRRYATVLGDGAVVHGDIQVTRGGVFVGPGVRIGGDLSARGLGSSTAPNDATGRVYLSIDETAQIDGTIETEGNPVAEAAYTEQTAAALEAAWDLGLAQGAGGWEDGRYQDGWHELPPDLPYDDAGGPRQADHNLALRHAAEAYAGSGEEVRGLGGEGFLDGDGRPLTPGLDLSPGYTFSSEEGEYRFTVSRMHGTLEVHNDQPTTIYVGHAGDWHFDRLRFTGNAPVTIVSDGTIRARMEQSDGRPLDFDLRLAAPSVVFDQPLQVGQDGGTPRQLEVHAQQVWVEGADSTVLVQGDAHLAVNPMSEGAAPGIRIGEGALMVAGALKVETHGQASTAAAGTLTVEALGALRVGGPLTFDGDRLVLASGSTVDLRSQSYLFVGDAAFVEPATGLRNAALFLNLDAQEGPFSETGPRDLRSGELQATFSQPSQVYVFAPHGDVFLGPDSQLMGALVARSIGGKALGEGLVPRGQPVVGLRFRQDEAAQAIGSDQGAGGGEEILFIPFGSPDSKENTNSLINGLLDALGLGGAGDLLGL